MNEKKDSFVEIALKEMIKKKKAQTIEDLCKKIFKDYGIERTDELVSQFLIDFMLSGYFVYVGEDDKGHKLWNLKNRELSNLLDKEGGHLEDIYEDDEDAIKNELKDENAYGDLEDMIDEDHDKDEDDEENSNEENDEIEEELESYGYDETKSTYEIDEEDETEEDSYDDKD